MTAASLTLCLPDATLLGDLVQPADARGLVLFAHGSGSGRNSSRNRFVADALQQQGFATLLFDLLTDAEDRDYATRFDIPLLTRRLLDVTAAMHQREGLAGLPLAYFGASTGAAAVLRAAARLGSAVFAVVSRGGRPDLAMDELPDVRAPTLLIAGSLDAEVLELNRRAQRRLQVPSELAIVPGASHLFEEPGALEHVAELAVRWLERHAAVAGVTDAL